MAIGQVCLVSVKDPANLATGKLSNVNIESSVTRTMKNLTKDDSRFVDASVIAYHVCGLITNHPP